MPIMSLNVPDAAVYRRCLCSLCNAMVDAMLEMPKERLFNKRDGLNQRPCQSGVGPAHKTNE